MNTPHRTTRIAWELAKSAQMIDEAERLATFDQSARTVDGVRAEYLAPGVIEQAKAAA